ARVRPRVRVPKTASAGETVTIKSLISHPMETGRRRDRETDALIPRQIINRLTITFNGEVLLDAALEPAVSANPYFSVDMVVPESGTVAFTWVDDDGAVYTEARDIQVV
ncbi:MAG: thiosulfate oxidation carrier complex protein SoxZ, partial [Pseudomonadota bacterium]